MGKVTALTFERRGGGQGDLWAGTEARGVFVYRDGQRLEHFTFENTAGGLRSNQIHSVFIDREGVAWFATDRGVCRYDPGGLRVEAVGASPESNVARVLFQSSDSTLWCGTNRGLFVQNDSGWQEIPELKGRIIHSIAEEPAGRLLIGTASGCSRARKARRPSGNVIELEDDGRGFDTNKAAKKGRGLTNMRSRASLIEASVSWSTRPDGGSLFALRKASVTQNEH